MGMLAIAVGLLGLKYLQLALVIDQDGIRLLSWTTSSMSPRRVLVPWDEIEGVELVNWADIEGDYEAIVLGLTQEAYAKVTGGRPCIDRIRASFEKVCGPTRWEQPFILVPNDWDHTASTLVDTIDRAVRKPEFRSSLGKFAPAS